MTCRYFSQPTFPNILTLSNLLTTIARLLTTIAATIAFTVPGRARAEFRSRNEIGLGFTDNANLEAANRDSDSYLRATTTTTFNGDGQSLGGRLRIYKYAAQPANDLFSWRAFGSTENLLPKGWTLMGGLFGNQYFHGAAGTTESSFNNLGFEVSAESVTSLNSKTDLTYGPFYEFRNYTDTEGRSDHTISGNIDADYRWDPSNELNGRGELGFVASSNSAYSKAFIGLGARWDHDFSTDWRGYVDLDMRFSSYTNREVGQVTYMTKQKNGRIASSVPIMESQSLSHLTVEADYALWKNWELGTSLTIASQSTRSGSDDYTSSDLFAKLFGTF